MNGPHEPGDATETAASSLGTGTAKPARANCAAKFPRLCSWARQIPQLMRRSKVHNAKPHPRSLNDLIKEAEVRAKKAADRLEWARILVSAVPLIAVVIGVLFEFDKWLADKKKNRDFVATSEVIELAEQYNTTSDTPTRLRIASLLGLYGTKSLDFLVSAVATNDDLRLQGELISRVMSIAETAVVGGEIQPTQLANRVVNVATTVRDSSIKQAKGKAVHHNILRGQIELLGRLNNVLSNRLDGWNIRDPRLTNARKLLTDELGLYKLALSVNKFLLGVLDKDSLLCIVDSYDEEPNTVKDKACP